MNRLNPNHLNGWSNAIDNMYFLEELISDGVKALMRDIGLEASKGFKFIGAEVTSAGDDKNVTAGWICLEGEILQVDAHTATGPLDPGEVWYWAVAETNDTSTQDEDADGQTIYVVKKRRATLVRGAAPVDYMPANAQTYAQAKRSADDSGWQVLAAPSGYTGTVETRLFNGCLHFRGYWTNLGNASAQITLPSDRRPSQDVLWYVAHGINGDTGTIAFVSYLSLTGKIQVPGSADLLINFNDIAPVPIK